MIIVDDAVCCMQGQPRQCGGKRGRIGESGGNSWSCAFLCVFCGGVGNSSGLLVDDISARFACDNERWVMMIYSFA